MTAIRTPQSLEGAEKLCSRFAENAGSIALTETARDADISKINAKADAEIAPLIAEQGKIAEKLSSWWDRAGPELTQGKRKSIELGGCIIGTKAGRASLEVKGDTKELVETLTGERWGKPLLRVTTSLDKRAIGKALDGKHGDRLREMGFDLLPGEPSFEIKPVEQFGTLAKR